MREQGDTEYARFSAGTGITLESNCGIDTSFYDADWRGVSPRVEVVLADFGERVAVTATHGTRTRPVDSTPGDQLALLSL